MRGNLITGISLGNNLIKNYLKSRELILKPKNNFNLRIK